MSDRWEVTLLIQQKHTLTAKDKEAADKQARHLAARTQGATLAQVYRINADGTLPDDPINKL